MRCQKITSIHNPKVKNAIRLHSSRGRRKQDRIIIFGWRELNRALNAGVEVDEIFVCESLADTPTMVEVGRAAETNEASLFSLPENLFGKLQYGDRSDGVIATALRSAGNIEDLAVEDSPFYLILQGVEKPGNLGAVVRSADGAGVAGVIVVDGLTDVFHPNSIRTSMGTVFSTPIVDVTKQVAVDWLMSNHFKIVIARPDATLNFFDVDLTGKTAIVLGNEAHGLSDDWNTSNVIAVRIPMSGIADSLNVAATASIAAYEAYRQRNQH